MPPLFAKYQPAVKFCDIEKSILQVIKAQKENTSSSNTLDADENILGDTDDGDNTAPAPASAEANDPADATAEDKGDACFMAHPAINLSSHAPLNLISTKPVISKTHAPQPTPIQQSVALVPNWD